MPFPPSKGLGYAGDVSKERPTMKERQWLLREEAILDAADELLRSKGYVAMTLDDVVDIVGVSKPTLYLHFRSKEELLVSVAIRTLHEIRGFVQGLDPEIPVRHRLETFIEWLVASRFAPDGLCCDDFAYHLKPLIMDPQSPYRQEEQGLIDDIDALMSAGQEGGAVRKDVPASFVTQALLSIVRDAFYDCLIAEEKTNEKEITLHLKGLFLTPKA